MAWLKEIEEPNNGATATYWEIPSGLAPELAAGAIAFVTGYARAQPEFEDSEDVT